ncbi:MAG: metalloprotease TldD [Succinivibrionaceae bacterium]|nr:metalloprotease TldD [Succinivibrionaceae bacterium]
MGARDLLWGGTDIDEGVALGAMELLLGRNLSFADLFFSRSSSETFSLDEGIINDAHFGISKGFGVRAVREGQTGFAYSDRIDAAALREACLAARSISTGGPGATAPVRIAPCAATPLYVGGDPRDSLSRAERTALLERIDRLCRAADPRVTKVMASLSCRHVARLIINERGEMREDLKPMVSLSVTVVMESHGRREDGRASAGGAFLLPELLQGDKAERLAREAVRVAAVNMESVPAPAGSMPVVLAAGWPAVLIHEAVGHGLEGDFNRVGSSAFSGRIGERVASEHCTIIDDGTMPSRRGSSTFDDEGTPTGRTTLIEKGILRGYMQDRQNAMLMGMPATGNGRRESYNCLPLPRMTNTCLMPGKYGAEEIIAAAKRGIYAVNFTGGQVDITSGRFVFAASEAYLIENGRLGAPIKGATLIGNGPEVMQRVSMVGDNLTMDDGVGMCGKAGQGVEVGLGQPTLLIDEITVGGTS